MADWPAQADYRDALQNVATALRADVLHVCPDGEVERNKMKVPRARAGAFATVYKLICPGGGATALKLFNFPSPDRERRYRAVDTFIRGLGKNQPAGLVGFRYESEGIFVKVRGQRMAFPVQTMDWVKGESLGKWFIDAMTRKDTAAVRKMADLWAQLVDGLQRARIAHGDLQHDNVMVVNNAPMLVDYDGMVVPELEGDDQLEFGKPAYQHPKRVEQKLSLGIDHFSAWVILIALRAAAADPGLFTRYNVQTDNENLLFTGDDLSSPKTSALWGELLKFKADPDVPGWADALRASLDKPFADIPPFLLDPYAGLPGNPPDWARLATVVAADERAGRTVPAKIAALAAEAKKRLAARDNLQAAVALRDPRAVAAAYKPDLLGDWPAAAALKKEAEAAAGQVAALDRVKAAFTTPGDGRALVTAWAAEEKALAGVKDGDEYRKYQKAAADWKAAIEAADGFRAALADPAVTEHKIAQAWDKVASGPMPHPSITPADKARGKLALERAAALSRLRKLPDVPTEASDKELAATWAGTDWKNCAEAERYERRAADAKTRLGLVAAVARAVAAADAGGSEQAVVDAGNALAPDYAYAHADRVTTARARVEKDKKAAALLVRLNALLARAQPSDREIAAAWADYKRDHPKATRPKDVARCELAAERVAALAAFDKIDKRKPLDAQDREWLDNFNKHRPTLTGCHDAQPLVPRIKEAKRRTQLWAELSTALAAEDVFAVAALAREPDLAGYPPVVARQAKIDDMVRKGERIRAIEKKLGSPNAGDALAPEDLDFLREHKDRFGPEVRAQVERAVGRRLAAQARLSPGQPAYKPGRITGQVLVRWGWVEHGLVSSCVVATDPNRHFATPAEAARSCRDVRLEDYQRAGSGTSLPWPETRTTYVTVWPRVDLGWTTLDGPPLHVAPIPPRRKN